MSIGRIKWLAVLLPAVSVVLFEYLRHRFFLSFLSMSLGNVVTGCLAAALMYGFVRTFQRMIERCADEAVRARAEKAVVLERQRIAREMHDSVAQALFYLSVKLHDTAGLVAAGRAEAACSELQAMQRYTDDAYHLVKAVIADLKSYEAEPDFRDAIRGLAAEAGEHLGLQVSCEIADTHLSAVAQQHLVAILQEALRNAHRHGHARSATIQVRSRGRDLVVEVIDDGTGFDPAQTRQNGHFGLAIMAERARMIGGELALQSRPGHGTRVSVHLTGVPSV